LSPYKIHKMNYINRNIAHTHNKFKVHVSMFS